tara:strand:- start:563 stop:1576 length:1014 start_codon:yes stop_codon:yes gene_type:complete
MASNNRIFYAVQSVAITPRGTDPITAAHIVHGLQSVGMSSTFTLDQVFEMGQIEIYENIEEVADIEVTLEKVIDGYKLIYDLATNGECKTSIVSASKQRSDCYLAVFDDGQDHATGIPQTVCMNSGMYVSSVSYSYSIDGSATESVTLVGNDRFWNTSTTTKNPSAVWASNPSTNIDGTDTPLSGVVRRTDILLGAGGSTLPSEVNLNEGSDPIGNSSNRHVQSISVSTDFGQENIQELGRFGPYFRFATFPVEVTAEFEVVSASGDMISVSGSAPNLTNSTIIIKDNAGTVLNLGTSNKLSSVSYSGGDTGGGNATVSYSYSNFNVLTVNGGNTHA